MGIQCLKNLVIVAVSMISSPTHVRSKRTLLNANLIPINTLPVASVFHWRVPMVTNTYVFDPKLFVRRPKESAGFRVQTIKQVLQSQIDGVFSSDSSGHSLWYSIEPETYRINVIYPKQLESNTIYRYKLA